MDDTNSIKVCQIKCHLGRVNLFYKVYVSDTIVNRILGHSRIENMDSVHSSDMNIEDSITEQYWQPFYLEREIESTNYDQEKIACSRYQNAVAYAESQIDEYFMSELEIASQLHSSGLHDQAKEIYNMILKTSPKEVYKWLAQSHLYSHENKWELALQCYYNVINFYPYNPDILYNIAYTLHKLKRWDEALEAYDRVLDIQPENDYCHLNKGIIYDHLERDDEALQCYDRALMINPLLYHAWEFQGNIYFSQKKYEEAYVCFTNACNIEPDCISSISSKADTLSMLERWEEAIHDYNIVIKKNPDNWQFYADRARAYSKIGELEKAKEGFKIALEMNPVCSDTWIRYGVTLSRMGKIETAIQYYDIAILLKPTYFLPWKNKGAAYFDLGVIQKSHESYNSSISLALKIPEVWYNKAVLFVSDRKLKSAYRCLINAIRCDINQNEEEIPFSPRKEDMFGYKDEKEVGEYNTIDALSCLDFCSSVRSPGQPTDRLKFELMREYAEMV